MQCRLKEVMLHLTYLLLNNHLLHTWQGKLQVAQNDKQDSTDMSHEQFVRVAVRWRLLKQGAILHVERMDDAIIAGTAH